MKRVAIIFLAAITLGCSSLVWGSPASQAELLEKIAHQRVDSYGVSFAGIDFPNYTSEEDLSDDDDNIFLKTFIKNEIGSTPKALSILNFESGFPLTTHVTDEAGNTYLLSFFNPGTAKRLLKNLPKFDALNLKHFKSPPVVALAEYTYPERPTYIIVVQSTGSAQSLCEEYYDYSRDFSDCPDADARLKEHLIESYYHVGLALGELHQKTRNERPFHYYEDDTFYSTERDLEVSIQYLPFLKPYAQDLRSTLYTFVLSLQATPQTYCFSLLSKYHYTIDLFFDPKTKIVYADLAKELGSNGYNHTYQGAEAFAFIDYFKMLEGFCPPEIPMDRAPFQEAFSRGYQEAGGTLPTPEQEEIYRFLDAIKTFKEYRNTPNTNHLWDKLLADK